MTYPKPGRIYPDRETAKEIREIIQREYQEQILKLTTERTYYRDMWLAQRVENENYRKQLGLVAVSDEAERELNEGKG